MSGNKSSIKTIRKILRKWEKRIKEKEPEFFQAFFMEVKWMQPKIGMKENIIQFILLVVTNLFVGSMVGIERIVLPLPILVVDSRSNATGSWNCNGLSNTAGCDKRLGWTRMESFLNGRLSLLA